MDDPIGRAIENAQNAIIEASAEIARLRAALDAMTAEWEKEIAGRVTAEAERDAALNALQFYAGALYGGNIDGTGCAFGRHQGQDVWDRGEIAAAAIHAMKAHNADLGATLDARVQAAQAKALEDAARSCEETAEVALAECCVIAEGKMIAQWLYDQAATLRAMKAHEDKG